MTPGSGELSRTAPRTNSAWLRRMSPVSTPPIEWPTIRHGGGATAASHSTSGVIVSVRPPPLAIRSSGERVGATTGPCSASVDMIGP